MQNTEKCGTEDRQRSTGIQKGKRSDRWDVYIETVGREEISDARGNPLGFVDFKKAYDTVLREIVMVALRCMGVPEEEVCSLW